MTELLLVGTSDAFGSGGRNQSAYLLREAGGAVLVDCGATTNGALAQHGVDRDEIDAVVVSHFHGDHFGGIPLLLSAAHYQDRRRRPLLIAGPPDVEARVRAVATALGHPIDESALGFALRFVELAPGAPQEIGPLRVRAFETRHAPESHPHGLSVEAGARRVVYSGDTGWFDGLAGHVAGADLFLCECTFPDPRMPHHLSLAELDARRDAFRCGRMVITHLGKEMRALDATAGFERADDGMRIVL